MRNRPFISNFSPPDQSGRASDESDQDGTALPKGRKFAAKNLEKPADEMARLIRVIAGKPTAGEKDEQLRARAARRLGISASRAKVLWYGETTNIRSDEMDEARRLAAVQPIEEYINAAIAAEKYIEELAINGCFGLADRIVADLLGRLLARAANARGGASPRPGGDAHLRVDRPASSRQVREVVRVRPVGSALNSSAFSAGDALR